MFIYIYIFDNFWFWYIYILDHLCTSHTIYEGYYSAALMNFILQLSCTNMLVCSRGFSAVIAACERECRERHRNKQRKAFARKCAPAQRGTKMMGFGVFSDLFAYLLMHGLQIEMIKGVISTAPHSLLWFCSRAQSSKITRGRATRVTWAVSKWVYRQSCIVSEQ